MDTKYYKCHYCFEEFIPKRRYVQKFCSNTCRSKAHHNKKRIASITALTTSTLPNAVNKVETMSAAGIGNAAAGAIAANVLKSVFTDSNNKPATKGDIIALTNKIKRFHKILNLPFGLNGTHPYFDIETKQVVYFNRNSTPN